MHVVAPNSPVSSITGIKAMIHIDGGAKAESCVRSCYRMWKTHICQINVSLPNTHVPLYPYRCRKTWFIEPRHPSNNNIQCQWIIPWVIVTPSSQCLLYFFHAPGLSSNHHLTS